MKIYWRTCAAFRGEGSRTPPSGIALEDVLRQSDYSRDTPNPYLGLARPERQN